MYLFDGELLGESDVQLVLSCHAVLVLLFLLLYGHSSDMYGLVARVRVMLGEETVHPLCLGLA